VLTILSKLNKKEIMAFNWTVEERFATIADNETIYRILHVTGGAYACIYLIPSPGGAVATYPVGQEPFMTLEEAVQACEEHYANKGENPVPPLEPMLTTEELLARYG
jgi:hypothetical protein